MKQSARYRSSGRQLLRGCLLLNSLWLGGCAVGPDYQQPSLEIPATFKEGTEWQRTQVNPQGALDSTWWQMYQDETLSQLIEQSLQANPSITAAEAAYRYAQATLAANRAALFPTVATGFSATRSGSGERTVTRGSTGANAAAASGVSNVVSANLTASWEPDFWGEIRRDIEAGRETVQATDAQLAGQRLSITASVANTYFQLRQADIDIQSLLQQQQINARLLEMTQIAFRHGTASNDNILMAQNALSAVVANLQASQTEREQYEHALAVLTGVPPAAFTLPAQENYAFNMPAIPLLLPAQLLERRPDVVSAERLAASANARIGVAEAAFFPAITFSVQDGFEHSTLADLFSLPNRVWTLGPALAATLFDGGARSAAVQAAQATYDEQVATYRSTVLAAFQNVEDALSAWNHLQQQVAAYQAISQSQKQLFASGQAQLRAGTASEQMLLTQQLTLLQAEQQLHDAQAQWLQSSISLVKALGGGWQEGTSHTLSSK